jgi:hypothetical protein
MAPLSKTANSLIMVNVHLQYIKISIPAGLSRELGLILKEIRVITEKIKVSTTCHTTYPKPNLLYQEIVHLSTDHMWIKDNLKD